MSFRENPLFETSGMTELKKWKSVQFKRELHVWINGVLTGAVIGAAFCGLAVLIFA